MPAMSKFLAKFLLLFIHGLTMGKRSILGVQDRNPSVTPTQPGSSLPSTFILIHNPSGLLPSASTLSPFERTAICENVLLGPLRTFRVPSLATVQVKDNSRSRIVNVSKWICVLGLSKLST